MTNAVCADAIVVATDDANAVNTEHDSTDRNKFNLAIFNPP
jgi:hypothetical protein